MYDEDVIIIKRTPETDYRNGHPRSRSSNRDGAEIRDHRGAGATRVYHVPPPRTTRDQTDGRANTTVTVRRAAETTDMPYYGSLEPASQPPQVYYAPHGSMLAPVGPSYPYPVITYPSRSSAIPVETLSDGVTLIADAVAAFLPLPSSPPEPTGDEVLDRTNQNEHRHAIASHDKMTQRIRTGGRVLGGLLKLVLRQSQER
ncbi:MAG: hypothetical protein MJE77_17490 [Proteobacteria bacterium]|nr:hypothetical protein [Pseudomonadota bacterium]